MGGIHEEGLVEAARDGPLPTRERFGDGKMNFSLEMAYFCKFSAVILSLLVGKKVKFSAQVVIW